MIENPLALLHSAIAAGDDDLAEELAQQLPAGNEHHLAALTAWLTDPDPNWRWWGVRALAVAAWRGAQANARLELLRQRLHDTEPSVRCAAALAIAELKLTAAAADLIEMLNDPNGWVRAAAAAALALLGEGVVPALAAVLAAGPPGARARAAHALSKIRTLETAQVFYHYLDDDNQLVQTYAFDTLEQMGLLGTVLVV